MDIVEFAEEICGGKLPHWQKELLTKYKAMPPDVKLVYHNGAFHMIKNDEKQENNKPEITHEYSQGLTAKFTAIDENAGYFFDPTIVFDKDGGIRITEVSLMRKPLQEK